MAGSAMHFHRGQLLIGCLFLLAFCDGALRLNVPKLLLPYYSQVITNFTLEATEGCLFWRSTRTDVASVHPVEVDSAQGCSRKAVVAAVSRSPKRKTVVIFAEDSATGRELRCDVIVDKIVSMEIQTTTKELYLDDSPEEFNLVAYNDKGDVFSSLEGMEFQWNLLADENAGGVDLPAPNNVLRILKFHESSYVAPDHIKALELQGKRGNMVLVKGLHTGTSIVSVRPSDEVYKDIKIPVVRTMVVANLQLSPGLVYLLPRGEVKFTVELLKQGKAHEVTMPSTLYYLEVEDEQVASLDESTSTLTGTSHGYTELRLKGHNAQLAGIFREPSAGIHVVYPSYIEFSISPKGVWVLEVGALYNVALLLFDESGHKITITQNLNFETEFPSDLVEVLFSTHNGTHHVVRGVSKGSANIQSRLLSSVGKDGGVMTFDFVEGRQPLEVLDPVSLNPAKVVLPYLSDEKSSVQFEASGGTGTYDWKLDDPEFGSVHKGRVQLLDRIGSTWVHAVDSKYPTLKASAQLTLAPPTHVLFLEEKVEVELGKILEIPIQLVAGDEAGLEILVTKCHHVPFQFHTSVGGTLDDFEVVESSGMNREGSCAILKVLGSSPGNTQLSISYDIGSRNIRASIILSVYHPLKMVEPLDGVVLTPGSSGFLVLSGGPPPWVLDQSGYFRSASKFVPEGFSSFGEVLWNLEDGRVDEHILKIRCLDFGEGTFSVEIGNIPTESNKRPDSSAMAVKIFCSEPKFVKLRTSVFVTEDCPMDVKAGSSEIPVSIERTVTIHSELYDEHSRIITNTSSVIIDWTLSDSNLASLEFKEQGRRDVVLLRPIGTKGKLDVSASVSSYGSVFRCMKLPRTISSTLSFKLLKQPSLRPSEIFLYNHKMIEGKLKIEDGSNFYRVSAEPGKVANVVHDPLVCQEEIKVSPLSGGHFDVTVSDLCLSPTVPVKSSVVVSDVHSVVLSAPRKMPLHGEAILTVEVLDGDGRVIPSEFYHLMDPVFKSSSDILVISNKMEPSGKNGATYQIEARSLGSTSLVVAVSKSGIALDVDDSLLIDDLDNVSEVERYLVLSNAVEIQVFPPLRIEPKEITITPGTAFQMQAYGGPLMLDTTLEFVAEEYDGVLNISKEGLMSALAVGVQRIAARSVGSEGDLMVLYSEDFATVNVVEMKGMKISCPIKTIRAENEMPLVAKGLNGQAIEPYSFSEEMKFDWSVDDPHVARLRSPLEKEKKTPDLDLHSKGFAITFAALKPGLVTVTLKVTFPHKVGSYFDDSVVIEVLEPLGIISPVLMAPSQLLMMPDSDIKLLSSLDNTPGLRIEYKTFSKSGLVHVDDQGVLRSGALFGTVPVVLQAHNEEGQFNQTLSFVAEVKPLTYIMARPTTHFHDGNYQLPTGHEFEMEIGCYDNLGNKFHAIKTGFSFQLNRHDNILVSRKFKDESILSIRTVDVGFTILKIYALSDASIADYVGINVVESVGPRGLRVTLGSVVCFNSSFPELPDQSKWSSTNNDIISVDQSGTAIAHGIGSAHVVYIHKRFTAKTDVTVLPVLRLDLKPDAAVISNSEPSKLVRVLLSSEAGEANEMVVGDNCMGRINRVALPSHPYTCSARFSSTHENITFNQVFDILPFFCHKTGNYYCKFVSLELSEKLGRELSIFSGHVYLSASPGMLSLDSEGLPSDPVELLFLPAFRIVDERSLVLGRTRTKATLEILTTEDVFKQLVVTSENNGIVKVSKLPRYFQNVATFYLSLSRMPDEVRTPDLVVRVKVKVSCTGSGQTVDVFVKIIPDTVKDATLWGTVGSLFRDYYNWWFYGIIFIFSVLFLSLVYPLVQESKPCFVSGNFWIFNNSNSNKRLLQQQQQEQQHFRGINSPTYAGGSPRQNPRKLWTVSSPADELHSSWLN